MTKQIHMTLDMTWRLPGNIKHSLDSLIRNLCIFKTMFWTGRKNIRIIRYAIKITLFPFSDLLHTRKTLKFQHIVVSQNQRLIKIITLLVKYRSVINFVRQNISSMKSGLDFLNISRLFTDELFTDKLLHRENKNSKRIWLNENEKHTDKHFFGFGYRNFQWLQR